MFDTSARVLNHQGLMQCVYALTSDGKDIFADMTRVSMLSLRLSNPKAHIVLACDASSKIALEQCKHPVLDECDTVVSIPTPEGSAGFRNRYVKTSLRQHLPGAFLYLDADTVIRGNLSEIFEMTTSFSAAPNHSGSGDPTEMPSDERETFAVLGWPLPTQYYVNGGVLFFADTVEAHKFSKLWHEKWLSSVAQTGRFRDQPSLNSAVKESKVPFAWLPMHFNAQVDVRPAIAPNASVWHLYSSNGSFAMKTVFDQYILRLQEGKSLTPLCIERLCQSRHPWHIQNLIDWWCVQRILMKDSFLEINSFDRLWLSGNYKGAEACFLRAIKNHMRFPIVAVRSTMHRFLM